MKVLLLTALLFSSVVYGQGYATVGTSAIFNRQMNNSITIGAGYKINNYSAGIVADFYGVDKSKGRLVIAALDLRRYLFRKNLSPFVSFQPGYTMYGANGVEGHFAASFLVGANYKFMYLSTGYQYHSFRGKINSDVNSYRISFGINFQ
jgi:hypothetical protein